MVFSWGQGTLGKLGHGDDRDQATPQAVHVRVNVLGAGAAPAPAELPPMTLTFEEGKASSKPNTVSVPAGLTASQLVLRATAVAASQVIAGRRAAGSRR